VFVERVELKKKSMLQSYVLMICLVIANLAFAEKGQSSDQRLKPYPEQPFFWLEAEYLIWSIKNNPLPAPLLTSASYSDPLPGAIGQPHTHVLLGKKHVRMDWMSGFQLGVGAAIGEHFEIKGNYFLLPTAERKRSFKTSGEPSSPNFAVPIFDVSGICGLNGIPGETIFILPGPLSDEPGFFGVFDFRISSRLQGAECNGLYHLLEGNHFHFSGIAGFRWFQLHESQTFKAKTHTVPNVSFPGGFFNFSDRFVSWNNFLAAQLGIDGRYQRKKWKLEGLFQGALGAVLEQINIKGSSRTSGGNVFFETRGTANDTLPGGMFAEPTNTGKHKKSRFAYALEARVGSGYKIVRNLEMDIGYTFFWLSKVLRPGKQIDKKINSTRTALAEASRSTVGTGSGPIPFGDSGPAPAVRGPKRPRVHFKTSSFYAQGFDAGVTLQF
jgi:hypothetical protein